MLGAVARLQKYLRDTKRSLAEVEKQRDGLKEALKFYADQKHIEHGDEETESRVVDYGRVARKALAKLEEVK